MSKLFLFAAFCFFWSCLITLAPFIKSYHFLIKLFCIFFQKKKNTLVVFAWVYFWAPCSNDLFVWLLVLCDLDYIVWNWVNLSLLTYFTFSRLSSTIFVTLFCHINFKTTLSIFILKIGILIEILWNLCVSLWRIDILTSLSLPTMNTGCLSTYWDPWFLLSEFCCFYHINVLHTLLHL